MRPEFTSLPLYEIMLRIGVATLLALVAATFNWFLARDDSSSRFFFSAQVLVAVIVATMMVAIDERLPRALGLFASLSIVRFRMPIKSLRELVFIFLAVAIGVSAGSGAFRVAALGTATGLLVLLFISVFRENKFFGSDRRMLEVTFDRNRPSPLGDILAKLEHALGQSCRRFTESESRSLDGVDCKVYEIWVDKKAADSGLIENVRGQVPGVQSVRVLRLFNSDEAVF